jgi:predicted dehydrogenase
MFSTDSYEMLVGMPEVDAVYVATPTSHHYRHTMLALRAGKHVLCEKSFAANALQADAMIQEAHDRGLFLMEAMWSRFLPSWAELRRLIAEAHIADVRGVEAAFGGRANYNPDVRAFRHDLAGGALLDAAVYPIHLAQMIYGSPRSVDCVARFAPSGVDEQASVLLGFPDGQYATVTAGIRTAFSNQATIYGTEGMIVVPNFIDPTWLEVRWPEREPMHVDFLRDRHRFAWELDEAHRCILAGERESAVLSHDDTYQVMGVLDDARAAVGLRFPESVEAV